MNGESVEELVTATASEVRASCAAWFMVGMLKEASRSHGNREVRDFAADCLAQVKHHYPVMRRHDHD